MINGMNISYTSSKGKGLEPIQTKGKGCKPKKNNCKTYKGSGLKIFLINILWKIILF